jgi:hypothetical protein
VIIIFSEVKKVARKPREKATVEYIISYYAGSIGKAFLKMMKSD